MLKYVLRKVFGTRNERELKRIAPIVVRINELEPGMKALSDEQLKAKTVEFKQRVTNGEMLEDLLPEAFAAVREGGRRALDMRHFDVQMIGGIFLHEGRISEMRTGEGKTLVATLPIYLNALTGKGVHLVTVNDYLARRDSEWMGRLYKFMGLSVGNILHGLDDAQRKVSYAADITYGTNNEFGFDYLRDNMKYASAEFVQRPLNYAIVDEVDSILIDEARTPLIISGPAEESTQLYYTVNQVAPFLKAEVDYTVDEKAKTVTLTDKGVANAERRLRCDNLYDPRNINLLHHVNQALRAHVLFKRDVDYVVKDNEVVIVDEFTGRLMPGRRWSDGLHQAVEAKEGVRIENENQTLATITFQNYFRMYKKLAGMTGTADTEAAEFAKIYNLEVSVVPTNKPMVRDDFADVIYKTEKSKFNAVVEEVKECNSRGQPVLVGTISIDKSERLSTMLSRFGVKHNVLNAKYHEKEAEIIAQAGRKGAVTIATNMAGRGVDIILGGYAEGLTKMALGPEARPEDEQFKALLAKNKEACAREHEEVVAAGGLRIIGTERHESRRIDNQLRGRAGRQGDPGSSRFYLALQDDLLRVFGGERISGLMGRLGMGEDEVITHPWLSRAIANAQKRVEDHNFDIRKHILEYDDVMNQQRTTVYGLRRELLEGADCRDKVLDMTDQMVSAIVDEFVPSNIDPDSFEHKSFEDKILNQFGFGFRLSDVKGEKITQDDVGNALYQAAVDFYEEKEKVYGAPMMRHIEKFIVLSTLDALWKDHLLQMDHLKEGIGLRGYGQKDPLLEYKKEGYAMFAAMMQTFAEDVVQKVYRVQVKQEQVEQVSRLEVQRRRQPIQEQHADMGAFAAHAAGGGAEAALQAHGVMAPSNRPDQVHHTVKHEGPVIGRNDPCPCGSGKKHKKCCGA
jgi:preprotein translocase subunit SecA